MTATLPSRRLRSGCKTRRKASGGIDMSLTPNTITISVTSVNDPPFGPDTTVTTLEDKTYTFAGSDFGFFDAH